MLCKNHLADASSSVGVCASCLRERLFVVIAVEEETQTQAYYKQFEAIQTQGDHRKSDTNPRSVSPYISSTLCKKKKKNYGSSLLSGLFRSRSKKLDSDCNVSNSGDYFPASSSSPSWFSTILPVRRKKQSRMFSFDKPMIEGNRRSCHNQDRGNEHEHCLDGLSGYSSETLKRTPAAQPGRRTRGKSGHNRRLSGISFCLSLLVRASPGRQWNQIGMPPDMVLSGEIKVPAKPHLSNAVSFCKNRSRKLADFGRFNPNR